MLHFNFWNITCDRYQLQSMHVWQVIVQEGHFCWIINSLIHTVGVKLYMNSVMKMLQCSLGLSSWICIRKCNCTSLPQKTCTTEVNPWIWYKTLTHTHTHRVPELLLCHKKNSENFIWFKNANQKECNHLDSTWTWQTWNNKLYHTPSSTSQKCLTHLPH